MCENFVCAKLLGKEFPGSLNERTLPEPCFEHINCQICELVYDCDFCASRGICRKDSVDTKEKRRSSRTISKRND